MNEPHWGNSVRRRHDHRARSRWPASKRLACTVIGLFAFASLATAEPQRFNVLFIAVDDLRPQLGCYGHREMITPSIDRLAGEGRRFDHHYVQVPTCGASRCALLTGQYPRKPSAYDNGAFQSLPQDQAERPISLPQLFRDNGYTTISIGKISHSPDGTAADGTDELPFSWDEHGVPMGEWHDAWSAFFAYAGGKTRIIKETPVSERADVSDDGYPDGLIADAAIAKLKTLNAQGRPFFLAVGFFKPHLPFCAPADYWDRYDPDKLPAPANSRPPKNVDPEISLHSSGEMRGQYTGFSEPGIVTDEEAKHLRHAYAACVSYCDAQIGRVLDELERLGLKDNTIVVLWGDHGWHLGELGVWGKHTLYDVALRSPLIIRTPQLPSPGKAAEGLVESVDIYPTLAELCGLKPPDNLSGRSLAPILEDPQSPGKPAVFGFWKGGRGHAIRTPNCRLVEYTDGPRRGRIVQTELYDLRLDPGETENIADRHPEIVKELTATLHGAVPLLQQSRRQGSARQSQ